MPTTTPLPAHIDAIDNQIQTLELLKQAVEGLEATRESLGETVEVLGTMKGDLSGSTLSFKDLVKFDVDKAGNIDVSVDTSKIDPRTIDKTQLPANLTKEAIRAQEVLEEVAKPFADHQSSLLAGLKKLSSGLDRASALFGKVEGAVSKLEKAWDLFDQAMAGPIAADKLIEAFDIYFSESVGVVAELAEKVPGLGAFLEFYAKAIKGFVPHIKAIHGSTVQKNAAIASWLVPLDKLAQPATTADAATNVVAEQIESLGDQIAALRKERMELFDEHERKLAESAEKEVKGLWTAAGANVVGPQGLTPDRISDASMQNLATKLSLGERIAAIEAKDPDDPRLPDLRKRHAEAKRLWSKYWLISQRLHEERLAELERLVVENPHIFNDYDYRELVNRFPTMAPVVDRILHPEKPQKKPAAAVPVSSAAPAPQKPSLSTKVKATIGAGLVALFAIGGTILATGGGGECPTEDALMASGLELMAAEDPCPPPGTGIGDDADLFQDDPGEEGVVGNDLLEADDDLTGVGDDPDPVDDGDLDVDGDDDEVEPVEAAPPVPVQDPAELFFATPATQLASWHPCANVTHVPALLFPTSPSFFTISVVVVGTDGVVEPGTALHLEFGGADAPAMGEVIGNRFTADVPISAYGEYPLVHAEAMGPSGPLLFDPVFDPIVVGGAEGPVDGCRPVDGFEPSEIDELIGSYVPSADADPAEGTDPDPGPAPFDPSDPAPVGAFLDAFDAAHAAGDADFLFETLDPVSIDRYGADQCRDYLGSVVGSIGNIVLEDATPGPWDYPTDGLTTPIDDSVEVLVTLQILDEDPTNAVFHLRNQPGSVTWFTDCGEPA